MESLFEKTLGYDIMAHLMNEWKPLKLLNLRKFSFLF